MIATADLTRQCKRDRERNVNLVAFLAPQASADPGLACEVLDLARKCPVTAREWERLAQGGDCARERKFRSRLRARIEMWLNALE